MRRYALRSVAHNGFLRMMPCVCMHFLHVRAACGLTMVAKREDRHAFRRVFRWVSFLYSYGFLSGSHDARGGGACEIARVAPRPTRRPATLASTALLSLAPSGPSQLAPEPLRSTWPGPVNAGRTVKPRTRSTGECSESMAGPTKCPNQGRPIEKSAGETLAILPPLALVTQYVGHKQGGY